MMRIANTRCRRCQSFGGARRRNERTGQWRDKVMHKFGEGTTLLVPWRHTLWAALCGLRCSGRCSSWRRLAIGTLRQRHALPDDVGARKRRTGQGHLSVPTWAPRDGRHCTLVFACKETAETQSRVVFEAHACQMQEDFRCTAAQLSNSGRNGSTHTEI